MVLSLETVKFNYLRSTVWNKPVLLVEQWSCLFEPVFWQSCWCRWRPMLYAWVLGRYVLSLWNQRRICPLHFCRFFCGDSLKSYRTEPTAALICLAKDVAAPKYRQVDPVPSDWEKFGARVLEMAFFCRINVCLWYLCNSVCTFVCTRKMKLCSGPRRDNDTFYSSSIPIIP